MSDQAERLAALYDELVEKLYQVQQEVEQASQQINLEAEIQRLLDAEQEVERVTAEEASLLQAWLKRDLVDLQKHLATTGSGVAQWLALEGAVLGEQVMHWLRQIADPSLLDARTLEEDLLSREDPTLYHAGELAIAGAFVCTQCDKPVEVAYTHRLEPCHRCDGRVFLRRSAEASA
ncbi:zinc ribbon-containing protein [Marinospirillum sp.]|uniref:zinc ribbon-containing protein n=1 Tax=Marinospirillum sp. TaxID=2183934 RepID=UPI003A872E35